LPALPVDRSSFLPRWAMPEGARRDPITVNACGLAHAAMSAARGGDQPDAL
jgi:hypothetical protein